MKKIFLSLLIFAGLTLGMNASPRHGMDRKERKGKMTELNLSTDQQEKIKTLNSEFKAKFDDLKNNNSLTEEAKKDQRKSLKESRKSQLQAVLTPEQQAKFKEIKEKNNRYSGKKFADRKRNGHRGFEKKLNLTEDQKTKIEASRKSFKESIHSLRADSSLSKESRAEKRKELSVKHKAEFLSFLTQDQQDKIKENKEKFDKSSKKDKDRQHGKKRNRGNRLG